MGNRASTLVKSSKKLTGESVKIQQFEKKIHPISSTTSENAFPKSSSPQQNIQVESIKNKLQQEDNNFNISNNSAPQFKDTQNNFIIEDIESRNNPYVDPRISDTIINQSHQSNIQKITDKVNNERIEEIERWEEEQSVHKFGNALMTVSQDIQPVYENTVGDPHSSLAMHTPPKSELYAKTQKKNKYDDLEGMYKVVDIMNVLKEIRDKRKEEMIRRVHKEDYRGKLYNSIKKNDQQEEIISSEKLLDNYSIKYNIPREDIDIITKHFQYPNHVVLGGKEFGFWHDFTVKNLEIISDSSNGTNAESYSKSSLRSQNMEEESIVDQTKNNEKRSNEEIENDILKELQSMKNNVEKRRNSEL